MFGRICIFTEMETRTRASHAVLRPKVKMSVPFWNAPKLRVGDSFGIKLPIAEAHLYLAIRFTTVDEDGYWHLYCRPDPYAKDTQNILDALKGVYHFPEEEEYDFGVRNV